MIDISNLKKVHFVGIASGFSSFCANYLINRGVKVTASEINQESESAKEWIKRGVLYEGGHDSKYITDDLDLVVYPNGPIPGNPEYEETERKGIKSIILPKLVGEIGKDFKVIAIAGTHGKTTTSALTVWVLYKALGYLPNFIIGDNILGINKSWNYNEDSEYLVIEACEYKRQFLDRAPAPYISVITNIDLDHTDYYKDQNDYNSAFSEFLSNTVDTIIIDRNGSNVEEVLKNIKSNAKIMDCGEFREECSCVDANLIGDYNKENILRALCVGRVLGFEVDMEDFPGVASRMEYLGKTKNGMSLYMDYAHNPKKIKSCLEGVKSAFPEKRILMVWQPHSYERTYTFKDQFAGSISDLDVLYIPNIFSPGRESESDRQLISVDTFIDILQKRNPEKEIQNTVSFENTAKIIGKERFDNTWVGILASAGDLKKILNFIDLSK